MTRYADPLRCPDCSGPIAYGDEACGRCSLPLRGSVAQELFTTLTRADQLLVTLRAAVVRTAPAPAPPVAQEPALAHPSTPVTHLAAEPHRMTTASVPKILLSLGAGCLLVAALVFLAVTWSVMGVGGRTATLVGFTAVAGGITALVAHRGLRGAVESLGLVTLGLLALDVIGADNAGWLGDPSPSTFSIVLGSILIVASLGACLLLRGTPSGAFSAGEVVAGLGAGAVCAGLVGGSWASIELRFLVATLAAGALAALTRRLSFEVATVCSATVAFFSWVGLALAGFDQIGDEPTLTRLWAQGDAWPLLAAAALAASLAALTQLPIAVRQAVVSVGAALAAFVVVVPGFDEGATEAALIAIAVLAAATGVLALPQPWNATAWVSIAIAGLATTGIAFVQVATAASRWIEAAAQRGLITDRLPSSTDDLQPWLLPLAVVALLGAVVVAARPARWLSLVPPLAVAGAAATAALYPVPILALLGFALAAAAVFVARRDLVPAIPCLLAGVVLGLHSDGLTALALGAAVAGGCWVHLRDEDAWVREAAAFVAQLALAGSVWTWGLLLDQPGTWVAAVGIVLLAAPALLRRSVGLEVGAAAGMLGLFVAGASVAPMENTSTWIAVYLTLAGAATCIHALLRNDRHELGWIGGLLLAAATWVRLADIGVNEPEPYTLPSAIALLVVGLVHLRRNGSSATVTALGAGLSLALVPSLLWVLDDPLTKRSVLLGLACLALVAAGVQARWTAPLTFGAAVGALVVLRLGAPYLSDSSVPRWVLLGLAGTLLVAMGVTWEQRVNEARRALGYLRTLR